MINYVCGDTHGNIDIAKLSTKLWPEQKNIPDGSVLFHVGDFGLIWNNIPSKEEEYWLNWYDKKSFDTLVILGNHENYFRINSIPFEETKYGPARRISERVYFLKNGHIYNINNQTIWIFGGATSTDKIYRKEGVSWWPEEVPSYSEMTEGIKNLDNAFNKVDFIITHTIPDDLIFYVNPHNSIPCPVASYFNTIYKFNTFHHWYAGHFHIDKTIVKNKMTILYNNKPLILGEQI